MPRAIPTAGDKFLVKKLRETEDLYEEVVSLYETDLEKTKIDLAQSNYKNEIFLEEINYYKQQVKSALDSAKERQETIIALENANATMQASLDDMKGADEKTLAEKEQLQKSLEASEKMVATLERSQKDTLDQINNLVKALTNVKTQLTKAEEELSSAETALKDAKEKSANANRGRAVYQRYWEENKTKLVSTQEKLKKVERENASKDIQAKTYLKTIEELNKTLKTTEEAAAAAEDKATKASRRAIEQEYLKVRAVGKQKNAETVIVSQKGKIADLENEVGLANAQATAANLARISSEKAKAVAESEKSKANRKAVEQEYLKNVAIGKQKNAENVIIDQKGKITDLENEVGLANVKVTAANLARQTAEKAAVVAENEAAKANRKVVETEYLYNEIGNKYYKATQHVKEAKKENKILQKEKVAAEEAKRIAEDEMMAEAAKAEEAKRVAELKRLEAEAAVKGKKKANKVVKILAPIAAVFVLGTAAFGVLFGDQTKKNEQISGENAGLQQTIIDKDATIKDKDDTIKDKEETISQKDKDMVVSEMNATVETIKGSYESIAKDYGYATTINQLYKVDAAANAKSSEINGFTLVQNAKNTADGVVSFDENGEINTDCSLGRAIANFNSAVQSGSQEEVTKYSAEIVSYQEILDQCAENSKNGIDVMLSETGYTIERLDQLTSILTAPIVSITDEQFGNARSEFNVSGKKYNVEKVLSCKYEKSTGNVSMILENSYNGNKTVSVVNFKMETGMDVVTVANVQQAFQDAKSNKTLKAASYTTLDNEVNGMTATMDGVTGNVQIGYKINKTNEGEWHTVSAEAIIILRDDAGEVVASKIVSTDKQSCKENNVANKTIEVTESLLEKINSTLGISSEVESEVEA